MFPYASGANGTRTRDARGGLAPCGGAARDISAERHYLSMSYVV
jgi:hypothetical protein